MREIKFRLWLNHAEEMINDFSFFVNNGKIIADTGKEYTDIEIDNDIILMQYTGLKDKNGKEIYEGDIVQFLYKNPESLEMLQPVECEIFWSSDGAWCLKWFDKSRYENGARLNPEKYEVIGNIYENSNLLK